MCDIGAMVAELISAGCNPEVAAKVVAKVYVDGVNSVNSGGIPRNSAEEILEKRRAYDRERKRNSGGIPVESGGIPKITNNSSKDKKGISKGSRLPVEWKPSAECRNFARQLGWSESQIDTEAGNFRDYWIAKPGNGGVKLDWFATWRNWIRSSKVRPAGQASASPPDKISIEEAVRLFAQNGRWSRYSPVSDVCQAPSELLAKYGLLPDGRRVA
jgi:hypothetical protein